MQISQFSKSTDYSAGLSRLNYQYTINGPKETLDVSRIYQLDQMVLTHSIVDRSHGKFACCPANRKNVIAFRFIKSGHESHTNECETILLPNYTIGIFDLRLTSVYVRDIRTEGINLFIPQDCQTEKILGGFTTKIIDAEKGMGRVLLEMIFQITEQFPRCTLEENRLLLQRFIQLFCDWASQSPPLIEQRNYNELLIQATDYMRANLGDAALTIEQTASCCQTSIRTLQKVFQIADLSFSGYLNDLRLTAAAIQLFQSAATITAIAFQCGYNNSAYFSKRFKEKYHLSPIHYRKKMQSMLKNKTDNQNECPLLTRTPL